MQGAVAADLAATINKTYLTMLDCEQRLGNATYQEARAEQHLHKKQVEESSVKVVTAFLSGNLAEAVEESKKVTAHKQQQIMAGTMAAIATLKLR